MNVPDSPDTDYPSPKRKAKRTNKTHSEHTKIGMMCDEDFAEQYPVAWEILSGLDTVFANAGQYHRGKFRAKSKLAAYDVAKAGIHSAADILDCARWCFSAEKKQLKFWGSVVVNHLETILTLVPHWQEAKEKNKPKLRPGLNSYSKYSNDGQGS